MPRGLQDEKDSTADKDGAAAAQAGNRADAMKDAAAETLVLDSTEAEELSTLQSLDRLMILVGISSRVLHETTVFGVLRCAVEGALVLTDAKVATSGHGFKEGAVTVGASAGDTDAPPCPDDVSFTIDRGGVYLDLIERSPTIRLTEQELIGHPAWWGLPERHTPLKGLLGARLQGMDGTANGMLLVSWKRHGEFTAEDEALLSQLCLVTSLAIRHIEARNAEEERANELDTVKKRLETILESAPSLIYLADAEGRLLHVNRRVEELFGLNLKQIEGKRIRDLLPVDIAAPVEANNRQVVGQCVTEEFEEVLPKGKERRLYSSVKSPLFTPSGHCDAVVSISTDITAKKAYEQALRESEERFREVFAHAPVGMVIMDPEGRFLHVNEAYCRIMGYGEEEVRDSSFSLERVTHPDDRDRNRQELKRLIRGEIPSFFMEKRNIRKDGAIIWVRVSVSIRRGGSGRPVQVIALVEDIDDRKTTEERLNRAMEELARSNSDLKEFAYVVSHDLKEPLRMVSGFLQLLERKYKGRLDEKADTYIGFAVEGARRMDRLIDGLLSYSRIARNGKLHQVDMNGVAAAAVANLAATIGENDAEITWDALPTLAGDEIQLLQLLQNLIANAVKYRKQDVPPRVSISARNQGDTWLFSVRDNGIGIDPANAERIFQIFQRLHTQEEYEGTGIGLASCKKIVERHHGRIWVESAPEEGSTFFFTLPATTDIYEDSY